MDESGTTISTTQGQEGQTITLSAESKKTGYKVEGYYLAGTESRRTSITLTGDTTITVKFEPISYTIEFAAPQGAEGTLPADIEAQYDSEVTLPENALTQEGKVANGWRLDANTIYESKATVSNLTSTDGATVTLTANFRDKNSSIVTFTFVDASDTNVVLATQEKTLYEGETSVSVDLEYSGKTGYKAAGFKVGDTALTGTTYSASEDTTIAVVLEPISYTIKFDVPESYKSYIKSKMPEAITATYDKEVALPSNTVIAVMDYEGTDADNEKTDTVYHIIMLNNGWTTSTDMENAKKDYDDGQKVKNLSSVQDAEITISPWFREGDASVYLTGSLDGKDIYSVEMDSGKTIQENILTYLNEIFPVDEHGYYSDLYGYKFSGWKSSSESTETVKLSEYTMPSGTTYAMFSPAYEKFRITYSSVYNGVALGTLPGTNTGTTSIEDFTPVLGGTSYIDYTDGSYVLTADGYNFLGWYISGTETNINGFPAGIDLKGKFSYTSDNATVKYGITLEAKWEPSLMAVYFMKNQPSGSSSTIEGTMATQYVPYNTATELNKNTYFLNGYSFAGWNTKADGSGNSYADGAKISIKGYIYLYAQWKELPVKVTVSPSSPSSSANSDIRLEYNATDSRLTASMEGNTGFTWYLYDEGTVKKLESYGLDSISIYLLPLNRACTVMVTTEKDGLTYSQTFVVYATDDLELFQ